MKRFQYEVLTYSSNMGAFLGAINEKWVNVPRLPLGRRLVGRLALRLAVAFVTPSPFSTYISTFLPPASTPSRQSDPVTLGRGAIGYLRLLRPSPFSNPFKLTFAE